MTGAFSSVALLFLFMKRSAEYSGSSLKKPSRLGDFLKLQNTRLQNGVEHVVRLFCVAENLFVVRHRRGAELFPAHLADVFAVEPQELIVIEHGGRFADAVDGECFFELFQRENFLVILRAPAEQRDVVRDDRCEVAVFEEALKACGTVALRKL